MLEIISNLYKKPLCLESEVFMCDEICIVGTELRQEITRFFNRSLAIREVDCGSDNGAEIELANLSAPHYDVERFGITFVASPRHADALLVTGAVTHAMADALLKTYEAMPHPKMVIAVGDDACTGGIWKGTYAVLGGVDQIIPVDLKIPGTPPRPVEIMKMLLTLLKTSRVTREI
jgi:Ni,Fe-hydrogenase III small subunit